jgi:hypothetical protein
VTRIFRLLKNKLNSFNNKCEQSENNLNSPSEASEEKKDFGFITPKKKLLTLNKQIILYFVQVKSIQKTRCKYHSHIKQLSLLIFDFF